MDTDCQDSFRNSCQVAGNDANGAPIQLCLRESGLNEACGFEGPQQGLCQANQDPPLYCSTAMGTCQEAVIVNMAGGACTPAGDTTEPPMICDADSQLACDPMTATCIAAQVAAEGELCDPTGAIGAPTICQTDLTCIAFVQDGSNSRCHRLCDPAGMGNECTVPGTTCEALLTGGGGLCFDAQCTVDADCAYADYSCQPAQAGGNLCFPNQPSGPVLFGGVCNAANACNTDAMAGGDPDGFLLARGRDGGWLLQPRLHTGHDVS